MFWPLLWAEAKTEGGNLRGCAGPDLLSAARCLFVRPHPLCHGHVLFVRVLLFSCTHSFLHKSIYSVLMALCSLAPRPGAGFWVFTLRRSSGTRLLGPTSWSSMRNLLSRFIGTQTKSRKTQEHYFTPSHMLFLGGNCPGTGRHSHPATNPVQSRFGEGTGHHLPGPPSGAARTRTLFVGKALFVQPPSAKLMAHVSLSMAFICTLWQSLSVQHNT